MSLRQAAESPVNIEWRSDDGSTVVLLPTNVVDGIAGYVSEAYKSIPRRGAEAGGLLLGSVRIGRVTEISITGFEPVTIDYLYGPAFILSDAGQAEFRGAMARHSAGEILGYYRSHTRPGFNLETSDREMAARLFPGMSGIVLLIKPSSPARFTASYYFFQRGNLEMRPVGREFPFTGNIPGGTPPPNVPEPLPPPRKPELIRPIQEPLELNSPPSVYEPVELLESPGPPPAAPLAPPPAPPNERKSLQWEIVAAALMIAVAIGLLWWQYRGDTVERDPTAHASGSRVASLGLTVQPGEGGWRITWDPGSPAAVDSARGALNVTDGDSHERIQLDANQIRAGAVTYRPTSDDITFRLDLVRADNTLSSETYRVLLRPTQELVSVPAQAAKKSPMAPPEKPVEKPAAKPAEEAGDKEGYTEPEVLSRVAPQIPDGIRPRITVPQPIDVKVTINRQGRVVSATPIQHGEGLINYLADHAVAAAKEWTFAPARQNGNPVSSTRTIHFVFEQ